MLQEESSTVPIGMDKIPPKTPELHSELLQLSIKPMFMAHHLDIQQFSDNYLL